MPVENLPTGIAVVIDDEIDEAGANINNLVGQIERDRMPCLKYKELPDEKSIEHFEGVSFLLLDWRLQADTLSESITEGVTIPDGLRKAAVKENIEFLKKLKQSCFIPVFIFTNEPLEPIIKVLKDNDLYQENKPNFIFVKRKSDLTGRTKLLKSIKEWILKTPSIYVLKTWDKIYKTAKTELFYDFYSMSPNWPIILWKSFAADGVNMSLELGEVLTRNLHTRMVPYTFDDKILNKKKKLPDRDEVRKVLQGERFIKKEGLDEETICAGDLFKIKKKIYINIRPDCDCVLGRNTTNDNSDDFDLYLLKGSKLTENQIEQIYRKEYGNFEEIDNQAIIFSIINGNTYDFRFKDLHLMKWSNIKEKRIGRLLPPYITRIQQRYALYLQRTGLPRTPKAAVL